MILKTLTQRQLQWHALPCDHSNLAWPIYVPNTAAGLARLKPYTQIHCLSLTLSIHIRPAHEHAKHREYRTCHCLSASCMCSQPGFPKIKQIIITECNHPRQRKGGKKRAISHTYTKYFWCVLNVHYPSLSFSLVLSSEWFVVLLFCSFLMCTTLIPGLSLCCPGLPPGTQRFSTLFNELLLESIQNNLFSCSQLQTDCK